MLATRIAVGLSAIIVLLGPISAPRATSLASPGELDSSEVRVDTVPVPTDPGELRSWLGRGAYKTWSHQAAPHSAEAPHADQTQVYLNASLAESVRARKPIHHQGAAAVLEASDEHGVLWGWAVAVKVEPSSNHGRGWYWYMVGAGPEAGRTAFGDQMIPAEPEEAGLGVRTCVTCHLKGRDYVITSSLE